MNASKLKRQFESSEANKKLNDMKLAIEHAGMDKNKFASQMEDLRRAADNETRNRNAAETKITALERNIKTLMVEIDELRSLKITLEGSIGKWQAENADWKKKYENEARLRVEEVEAIKKKFTVEVTHMTDATYNWQCAVNMHNASSSGRVASSEDELDPTEREFLDGHDYEDSGQASVLRTPLRSLAGHSGVVISGDWLVGGEQVLTAGWDRLACIWDVDTGELLQQLAKTSKAAGNVMETIKVVKNTSIWLNNEVTIEELNKNFRSTTKMAADIEQKAD